MSQSNKTAPGERLAHIFKVFHEAHGASISADPDAWRGKFRKMAANAFAFYRGSAALFFADVVKEKDPFLNEKTSRVWIQGDLHAANFGTYMNSLGNLIFDVNDFDEAYIAPFTWDVKRLAASIYLLGYEKALSDADISRAIRAMADGYAAQVEEFVNNPASRSFALTLHNTTGKIHEIMMKARLTTRHTMLDDWTDIVDGDRRYKRDKTATDISEADHKKVMAAFNRYLKTIPKRKKFEKGDYVVKDIMLKRGMGIGSAGSASFNLLLEGPSEALENDIIIYMKPGQVAAPALAVNDPAVKANFLHDGHRTVVSQRALQAHADPWLGWTEIDGVGFMVTEASPYTQDIDWSGINKPDDVVDTLGLLGRAVAKIHCVSDEDSDHTAVPFSAERAIFDAITGKSKDFTDHVEEFGMRYGKQAKADHEAFFDAFRNGKIPGI